MSAPVHKLAVRSNGSGPRGSKTPFSCEPPNGTRPGRIAALGANRYTEGTNPFCRLPLPTLTDEARGYSPWRPDADISTNPGGVRKGNHALSVALTTHAHGPTKGISLAVERAPDDDQKSALYQPIRPLFRMTRFQGTASLHSPLPDQAPGC